MGRVRERRAVRSRVNVLFVSREYPPETGWGGIGSSIAAIAPALVARGHAVHVLSCVRGQRATDGEDHGVLVHRRDQVRLRGLRRIVRGRQTADRIETSASAYLAARRLGARFDVVEYPEWGAEGLLFALTRRLPGVAHLHTPIDAIRWFNGVAMAADARCASRLERAAVRRADRIIAPSRLLVDHLSRTGWLGGRAVEIIPYGIDRAAWDDVCPVAQTPPTVLFLGRLEARKSPETLVRALARLRHEVPGARGVFVGGSGGEREGVDYAEWCGTLEGADACVFVTHTPRQDLGRVMGQARVLALPSRFDNFPMAVLEAMAAGRPVVVSAMVGMAPMIEAASAGAVVPPGDSDALAAALRPLLASAAHAQTVGERGRRLARDAFDPGRIAAERERVYRGAIEAFGARR